jgi:cytochrome P450
MHQPECMAKLRAELQTVPEDASWTQLEKLPYLTGVIFEGLRLAMGVTARLARIAPDESLTYKQYIIPPGTPMSSTTLCIHTNETIFPDPWAFKPERWFGKEGTERRKYLMSFNKGARQCIGINLSYAEMYHAIATAAKFNMKLFETDESDVRFKHDFHAAFPKLDTKGVRATVL